MPQLAWAHAHEALLWASKGGRHTFNRDLVNTMDPDGQISSVWRIPAMPMREKSHGRHPTRKPLRLVSRAIVASTAEGHLVFDPFCGSGTTGVAAKELGRFFVGAEKEREYAELATRRIGVAEKGAVLREILALGRGRRARRENARGWRRGPRFPPASSPGPLPPSAPTPQVHLDPLAAKSLHLRTIADTPLAAHTITNLVIVYRSAPGRFRSYRSHIAGIMPVAIEPGEARVTGPPDG